MHKSVARNIKSLLDIDTGRLDAHNSRIIIRNDVAVSGTGHNNASSSGDLQIFAGISVIGEVVGVYGARNNTTIGLEQLGDGERNVGNYV